MKKIDSLTAIRFFAASAIVFMHSRAAFSFTSDLAPNWPLNYGVTFFFVLSGFILTYVHGDMEKESFSEFYIARFSRIWPAHIASFVLLLVLLPMPLWMIGGSNPILVPISNILLLQSFIPIPEYYFSFNAVSWSISTEMAFYIVFPFLLRDWGRTYPWKIATITLLAVAAVALCDLFDYPQYAPETLLRVTSHGIFYISPVTRIFEFLLGIMAAKAAIRCGLLGNDAKGPTLVWSVLELSMLALALYMAASSYAIPYNLGIKGGSALGAFLANGIGAVFFAVALGILAFQRGLLSRLLCFKPLVLLGEISFSLYLVHQILLNWYLSHKDILAGVNDNLRLALYWAACLALSYVIWRCIETPMRGWLKGRLRAYTGGLRRPRPVTAT